MIHDCGSFTVDYLYFGKPVLYDNPNIEDVKTTADELGKQAYDAHYRVKTLSDIKAFIDDDYISEEYLEAQRRRRYYSEMNHAPSALPLSGLMTHRVCEAHAPHISLPLIHERRFFAKAAMILLDFSSPL